MAHITHKFRAALETTRLLLTNSKQRFMQTSFRFKAALTTALLLVTLVVVTLAVFFKGGSPVDTDRTFVNIPIDENVASEGTTLKIAEMLIQPRTRAHLTSDPKDNDEEEEEKEEKKLQNSTSGRPFDIFKQDSDNDTKANTFGLHPEGINQSDHKRKPTLTSSVGSREFSATKNFFCYIHFHYHDNFVLVLLGNIDRADNFNVTERVPVAIQDLKIKKRYLSEQRNCFSVNKKQLQSIAHFPSTLFDDESRDKMNEVPSTRPTLLGIRSLSKHPSPPPDTPAIRPPHPPPNRDDRFPPLQPPHDHRGDSIEERREYFHRVICPKLCASNAEAGGTICNCDMAPLYL